MSVYYKRQNDYEAIRLYKASAFCYRKEYRIKCTTIFFSLLFCFIGIFLNTYLKINAIMNSEIGPELEKIISSTTKANSLAAGIYIVIQIFLNIASSNSQREAVHLEEMYDNYVYGIKPNAYTTRKISDPVIDAYARKMRKSDRYFQNKYFKYDYASENMVFDNQKSIIQENYDVLNYSKEKWFIPAWMSIIVIIFIYAVIADTQFVDTLQSIFFPSLTAITMVCNSWHNHTRSTKVIHTCLDSLNRTTDYNSPTTLRNIQDAIFNIRLRSFMIPRFISSRYRKYDIRQRKKIDKIKFKENYRLAYEEIVKRESTFDVKPVSKPVRKPKVVTTKTEVKQNELEAPKEVKAIATKKTSVKEIASPAVAVKSTKAKADTEVSKTTKTKTESEDSKPTKAKSTTDSVKPANAKNTKPKTGTEGLKTTKPKTDTEKPKRTTTVQKKGD